MSDLNKSVIICGDPRLTRPDLLLLAGVLGRGEVLVQPEPAYEITFDPETFKLPLIDTQTIEKSKEPWRRGRPLR